MSGEQFSEELLRVWRQQEVPVVLRRSIEFPLLVKAPFDIGNAEWLRNGQQRKPEWDQKYKAWQIPKAWFERAIKLCLKRYSKCYVIQIHREQQVCAAACWNAQGADCECSCMGANHGSGHPGGRWYEIDETLAVSWGEQTYACRLLRSCDAA
jgi:hypothetical protein